MVIKFDTRRVKIGGENTLADIAQSNAELTYPWFSITFPTTFSLAYSESLPQWVLFPYFFFFGIGNGRSVLVVIVTFMLQVIARVGDRDIVGHGACTCFQLPYLTKKKVSPFSRTSFINVKNPHLGPRIPFILLIFLGVFVNNWLFSGDIT